MKKWYSAAGLMLVAAISCQLTGCASTSRTFARWTGSDKSDKQLAEVDGKASKDGKSKADAKVAESSKSKKKTGDSAVAEKSKSGEKSTDKAVASKSSDKSKNSADVAKSESSTKTKPNAASSVALAESHAKKPGAGEEQSLFPKRQPAKDPFTDIPGSDLGPSESMASNSKAAKTSAADTELASKSEDAVSSSASPFDAPIPAGDLKPKSANQQVAQGTVRVSKSKPKLDEIAPPSRRDIVEVSHSEKSDSMPEWALEDAPIARSTEKKPVINQATATRLQPGQPAPDTVKMASASREVAPVSSKGAYVALCPEATGEVRELVKQLDSSDNEAVKKSIHRLGRMQGHAAAAAPALQKLLQHKDGFVRIHASLALVRIGQISPEVTDTLILGLRSPDAGVRSFAAAVLAEMGPNAGNALPALTASLNDRDGYVRLHVAEVLIRHADTSYQALQTVITCLQDRDENVRWLATYSLAELAPQSEEAVLALQSALHDPSGKVQVGAAFALGEIGPMAKPALEDLRRADLSTNAELRSAAEYARQQIEQ